MLRKAPGQETSKQAWETLPLAFQERVSGAGEHVDIRTYNKGWYGEGGGRRVQDGFPFKKKKEPTIHSVNTCDHSKSYIIISY